MFSARHLGNQYRSNAGQGASPQARNDTSDEDESCALGSRLKRTANQSEQRRIEKAIDTTNSIGSPSTQKAPDKGTEVVLRGQVSPRCQF